MTAPAEVTAVPAAALTDRQMQQRAALVITAGLIVLGALLGLLWAGWCPPRPPGVETSTGTVQINESEAFAAADGRFAAITAIVGLAVGGALWTRRSIRGPWVALALAVGGLAGAWLTAEVGHLVGGGTNSGPPQTEIPHLPLTVHSTGLYAVEGLLAVIVYAIFTAFAVENDLGRADPERDAARREPSVGLVQAQHLVQYGGAYGDGAGFAQQGEFPPQNPGEGL
jgi:hypothetical protein